MKSSMFKESYLFLEKYFYRGAEWDDLILFYPMQNVFYTYFHKFFTITIQKKIGNDSCKLTMETRRGKNNVLDIFYFSNEKEAINYIEKEIAIRQKISSIKKLFNM